MPREIKAAWNANKRCFVSPGQCARTQVFGCYYLVYMSQNSSSCGFELVDHPIHSPNLTPSDYYLFPNMKKNLREKQYQSDDDIIFAVENYLKCQEETFFKTKIQMLNNHWKKNVNLKGDYVEKYLLWCCILLLSHSWSTNFSPTPHILYMAHKNNICNITSSEK